MDCSICWGSHLILMMYAHVNKQYLQIKNAARSPSAIGICSVFLTYAIY